MYKLIIVDDEYSTRNGLKVCINWLEYGIEVIGEAENGMKGLALAQSCRPDIVLTDVKMPGMDGIEMVRRLREVMPEIKIVYISGYDDIAYLKSAIKMDAVDYILKPVNLDELTAVVEKIMDMSKREERANDLLQRMSTKLQQSIPLLKEKFLIQLIRDGNPDRAQIERRIDFLELRLSYDASYCALIIRIDNAITVFEAMSEQNTQLISFAIQNICQELVDQRTSGYAFENRRGEYVLIIALPETLGEDILLPFVEELTSSLHGFLKRLAEIHLTIGIGGSAAHLGQLTESYQTAAEAIERKLFLGRNQAVMYDAMAASKDVDYRRINELLAAIASVLKTGDAEQIEQLLEAIFRELILSRGIGYKDCQRICLQVLLVASQFLSEFGLRTGLQNGEESEVWEQLLKLETLEEMSRHIKHYLFSICRQVETKSFKKANDDVIGKIIRIIGERYAENLTISDIAQRVYLAKTYICLLFKQETGETINEYITRVRMEKAKELLKETDKKLADISQAIGYVEPSYFTKQFRKYTGMTPSEYRDIHRR